MNGITINDKQYIFTATVEDYAIHCEECDGSGTVYLRN